MRLHLGISFSINGVGEAARLYFHKDVGNLTLSESALLAGMIQSPNPYNPYRHPKRAKERRDTVLRAMRAHGNAAENIPAAIGAMLILSLLDPVPMWQLQVFGALFTIGRIVHAYGVSTYTGIGPGNGRVAGMAMSWAALIAMALALIWGAIAQTV